MLLMSLFLTRQNSRHGFKNYAVFEKLCNVHMLFENTDVSSHFFMNFECLLLPRVSIVNFMEKPSM